MKITTILLLATSLTAWGQTVKELNPTLGYLVDKSPEGEIEFNRQKEKCKELWERPHDTLNNEQKKSLAYCNDNFDGVENYYDILGPGCSWYCGGGMDTQTASSELKSQGQNNYSASNAHDLNYKTVWVEGVSGYGIGEYLVYHFQPENPRITKIMIVNGYVKSDKAWKENARVKKLKMYIDEKPFAILNLADNKNTQIFSFDIPFGYGDRQDMEKLKAMAPWTMRFEIMDVYKGDKYADTAITEIYFDGIDVH
jgi:hypothetical protein